MLNYNCRYREYQRVKILKGFYAGRSGWIVDYFTSGPLGMATDNYNRNIKEEGGVYTVRLSFLKAVVCYESALAPE